MNFIITANTDIGLTKNTNQDSISVKTINTSQGKMVFSILCDGMGGLASGEVASASVINAFNKWVMNKLPQISVNPLNYADIKMQWESIVAEQNRSIKEFGLRQGIKLGTTAVIILLTQTNYYIMNIGDSRAYEITDSLTRLTNDQTFVAREVALGNMTPEQAAIDERRNVLLQCIGASEEVFPDMFYGETKCGCAYMLCSDGFRHEITENEIYQNFNPSILNDEYTMNKNTVELIELNKQRMEKDNISVVLIRTY